MLPEPDNMLLKQNLHMLEQLDEVIKADEARIRADRKPDRALEIVSSMPGVGLVIGSVIVTETDGIGRFLRPERYVGYAGLSPSTHSSAARPSFSP